ncbi:hypothetical protein [Chryseobacterium sp. MDT2-18]|uniref:hypothetical protein n=1 Tax=Chryseobacterium sp. MDT2-18 TaxID=1259136 RepID=UPI002785DBAD|nr:hypothetical protein [Chryseobacterium sp. MDT2-18]MCZ2084574.1 hypothetical protein [Flavobacteriales bacterium]MDQ0477341.1 hypothetical protein [Chryseobacterium sp. MDT2-18]
MVQEYWNFSRNKFIFRSESVLILAIFLLLTTYSCKKEIRPDKGGIDLISNVYLDASKGLDKVQNFHISRMNYSDSYLLELIPDLNFPEVTDKIYYIKDSIYFKVGIENSGSEILSDLSKHQKSVLVSKKKEGALFSDEWIPNYLHRKNISDTVLFNKNYKRFEINSAKSFSRFYIYPTDTILPYSIYKHAEIDYGGRLERIDSYNKDKDIFVTLQLLPRKNWDDEAKEIFEFNEFVKKKK